MINRQRDTIFAPIRKFYTFLIGWNRPLNRKTLAPIWLLPGISSYHPPHEQGMRLFLIRNICRTVVGIIKLTNVKRFGVPLRYFLYTAAIMGAAVNALYANSSVRFYELRKARLNPLKLTR